MGVAREFDRGELRRIDRDQKERRYMIELGQRIRGAREERGLTQRAAAQAAGIATDMISRLENGRYTSPGLRTLMRIADGLGVAVSALLPDAPANRATADNALRARLLAVLSRAEMRELELIVDIATTLVNKARG